MRNKEGADDAESCYIEIREQDSSQSSYSIFGKSDRFGLLEGEAHTESISLFISGFSLFGVEVVTRVECNNGSSPDFIQPLPSSIWR